MNVVTISGDRQAGKTHALMALAAAEASIGQTVVWFAEDSYHAHVALQQMPGFIASNLIDKIRYGNGNRKIITTPGGTIVFGSANGSGGGCRVRADTVIWDALRPVPSELPCAYPDARIYASELTGADAGPAYLIERLLASARDYAEAAQGQSA